MGARGETSNWMADVDIFVDPDGSGKMQAASFEAISKLLLRKNITIQDVVTAIGKYLTSTDNSLRARALILLGELLVKLALTPLEDTTIHSLAAFFSARLADWHCLRGALIGSIALLRRSQQVGRVEESDVIDITTATLQNLHVQALGLTDRLMSLELYDCLLSCHGASVSSLGGDLIYGVCGAVEAEKDPRCLLVAFNLVKNLADLFPAPDGPFADYAQDLFDTVSCYFPVSFTPPPGDTRGISRDDLADSLLMVFTSTPLFAPFCIPVLLEKLSSSLQKAKLDSLKYLGACALSYGPKSISEHVGAIWAALKAELLPTAPDFQKDVQIHDAALLCLTQCVEAFHKVLAEGGDSEASEADFLKLICEDDCVEDLLKVLEKDLTRESQHQSIVSGDSVAESPISLEPEDDILSTRAKEQTRSTGKILAAVVTASPSSCQIATDKVLNRILSAGGLSSFGQSETLRKGFLSSLGLNVTIQILEGAAKVAEKMALAEISSPTSVPRKPITKKWLEPICSVAPKMLTAFRQVTLGQIPTQNHPQTGVAGLQALASFPAGYSPLTEAELHHLLSILVETLLDDTNPSELRNCALEAILTRSYLEEEFRSVDEDNDSTVVTVTTVVFPKLLQTVQEAQTAAALEFPLQVLAALASSRQTARQVAVSGLRQIIATQLTGLGAADGNGLQRMVAILECLSQKIVPLCEKGSTDQMIACETALDIWSAGQSLFHTTNQTSDEVLFSIMAFYRVTVRTCPEGAQEKILSRATAALLDSGTSNSSVNDLGKQDDGVQDGTMYTGIECTEERRWLVALVASIVLGLSPAVVFPKRRLLLKIFVKTSLSEPSFPKASVAAQAAASLINKWKDTLSGDRGAEEEIVTLDEAIRDAVNETLMPVINQRLEDHESPATAVHDRFPEPCDEADRIVRATRVLAWIGKGLAMRGHARVSDIAATLLALLQSEGMKAAVATDENIDQAASVVGFAQAAVESIGIFVKDSENCLDGVHNAVVRPLFKQRFFTSMLPPLREAVRRAGNSSYRIWFYRAFGHLLLGTPRTAVLTEGQKVFPLVLEGLSTLCNDPADSDLLLSTLLTLSSFLTDDNYGRNIAADHVPAMVKRLTILVTYRSSLVIRETALQCLGAIVGFPFARVYPEKPQVMKAINTALDDHKRRVRKEAVRCRRVWSAISS